MLYFNNFYKIPIEEFEDNHNEMKAIVLQKYAHQRIAHSEIQFGNYRKIPKIPTFIITRT